MRREEAAVIHPACAVVASVALFGVVLSAVAPPPDRVRVTIVRNRSEGPAIMEREGLKERLTALGCDIVRTAVVRLTPEEDRQYGAWNKAALESRSLGRLVSEAPASDLTVGLLTNCSDLLGMLAGLQRPQGSNASETSRPEGRNLRAEHEDARTAESATGQAASRTPGQAATGLAGTKPRRVGLVWIDAHADFNTPETTLSGMLGGMPVAIAAGMCLTRHRLRTGLDPALPTRYVTMAGLRDVDPLEQELLDRSDCQVLTVDDLRRHPAAVSNQIERLAALTDVIYVHIDMDVLDPSEVAGHPLTAPEGPTSQELAVALQTMFINPKAGALGIASMPFGERDKDKVSLKAAYRLIEGAIAGVKARKDAR
jgi:hypothetical protein